MADPPRNKRDDKVVSDYDQLGYIEQYKNQKLADVKLFVDTIINRGQPWTDPDFKPDITSLFDPNIDEGNIADYNKYTWKRISEIYNRPNIFVQGIEPNDIC